MSSIVIVISFSLLIIVSFCGNVLVCRTLFRQRRFCANSTNVLIGMLAISDLMMTIFNIPFTVADIILNDWIFGDFFCLLVSFVQANSVYVSSFTMAVIAIDRCKAIYKFRPKRSTSNNEIENNNINVDNNKLTINNESSSSNNQLKNSCCITDCFTINNLTCTCIFQSKKPTRFKMQLKTKMILIISAIWIMAALHSLPHTIFNGVTIIEIDNIIVDSGKKNSIKTNRNNNIEDDNQKIYSTDIAIIETFLDNSTTENFNENISSLASTTMIYKTNQTRTIRRCIPLTPSWFGPKFSLWLTLYTTATQYIIPLSCAAIIYTRIAFTINSQGKVGQMTESRAEKINKHKRKRLLMLALIVAIFAICWLPFNIYYLLLDFGITKSYNHTAFLFCLWLATSSVCYNPFVYCWLNKSFRQEAKNVINYLNSCCCYCRCCCFCLKKIKKCNKKQSINNNKEKNKQNYHLQPNNNDINDDNENSNNNDQTKL